MRGERRRGSSRERDENPTPNLICSDDILERIQTKNEITVKRFDE